MRESVLSWDNYFMSLAHLSAMRSKDPSTQVGACIVNKRKRVVGLGYNGFPFGCEDEDFPWAREGDFSETKYPYVVHAELNAILNATGNVENCSIYVSLFPCNECAKSIVQAGIKEVVYESNKYSHTDGAKASLRILNSAGVELRQVEKLKVEVK